MADDKNARDEQAHNAERRQRERELKEARARGEETEPIEAEPAEAPDPIDDVLADLDYPTTPQAAIEAVGDRWVETADGWQPLGEVLETFEDETFTRAEVLRTRIEALTRD